METKLILDAVHVGHGDCTIISFNNGTEEKWWHCIIDAGNGKNEETKNINEVIKERNIQMFDLAVLSHFDTDHIGGFSKIENDIPIEKYWSPYTPAIERSSWLFGKRGQKAVERAKELERILNSKGTILQAPVEGYSMSPIRGLKLKVFSPPIKLYKALFEKNSSEIVNDFDALIGEMVETDDNEDFGENVKWAVKSMYARYNNGVIARNFEEENGEKVDEYKNIEKKIEPEFFGNGVLNNTSLVIKIEAWTGSKWYDMLFPGDLENWLYLLTVRSDDLKSDFYKASHHGGRVYIDGKTEANDEVIQAIRSDIVMISANGRYDLPRGTARMAYERWVSNIFCTQKRKCELFSINGEKIPICNCCKQFECIQEGIVTSFCLDKNKIKVNTQSCITRSMCSTYPIVQLEQHLIPDSKVLTALTEGEISKQTHWLLKKLELIHKERKVDGIISNSEPINIKDVKNLSIIDNRNLTEQQINKIFEYGYDKNKLWMINDRRYYNEAKRIYKKANEDEINEMCEILSNFDFLLFKNVKWQKGEKYNLINLPAEKLFKLIEKKVAFPSEIIEDFCWPKIVSKIMKEYKYVYLEDYYKISNRESENFLIMIKSSSSTSYQKVIKDLNIKDYYNYYDKEDVSILKSVIDGDQQLFVCSEISGSDTENKEMENLKNVLTKISRGNQYTVVKEWTES